MPKASCGPSRRALHAARPTAPAGAHYSAQRGKAGG
jgi:hypothetical protein